LSEALAHVNDDARELVVDAFATNRGRVLHERRVSASAYARPPHPRPHRADASTRRLRAAMDRGDELPSQRARCIRAAVATAHAPFTCEAAM
jgi:hypothetical protein